MKMQKEKEKEKMFFQKKSPKILSVLKKVVILHSENSSRWPESLKLIQLKVIKVAVFLNKKNGPIAQLNRVLDYGSSG